MMYWIINNSYGHPLKNPNILLPNDYQCADCSQGKLDVILSIIKNNVEASTFLTRIQEVICWSVHPSCGPFNYFIILLILLLDGPRLLVFTRNVAFTRLFAP